MCAKCLCCRVVVELLIIILNLVFRPVNYVVFLVLHLVCFVLYCIVRFILFNKLSPLGLI